MQWTDVGIIISARKHGESSLILKIFTPSQGLAAGLTRASKKNRSTFQAGNVVDCTWKARLEEHLGNFTCEPKSSVVGFVMSDPAKLSALQSACTLIEMTLAERDPHPSLYYAFEDFVFHLKTCADWMAHYVVLEIELLKNLGFGLDLERCAATGSTENLAYVSPKSGRAVSAEAGEPYKDKLFKYPNLTSEDITPVEDIAEGLKLTHYFLEQHVFGPNNKKIPAARNRLEQQFFSDK